MAKNISSVIIVGLMLLSWSLGIYFLTIYFDTVLVIPTINDYLWTSPFKGILGLTSIITTITVLFFFFQYRFKLFKKQRGYLITHISHHVVWLLVVGSQLKVIAFNLGICH
ncbi:hypothetical protein GH741_14705 [Aquibacillus halophilus]|uniref:Uncharacterized protein n=1 Tax=Aquibacillus halophilus TaxID=930132 RepID=A0A6A8DJG5_9BACI|nr:hypothetical protein [Aquibacillus halophilus]MRH43891.1 hypothetical protein [Aquibacillus halophilus]